MKVAFSSQDLALIASLSAAYTGYSLISSYAVGQLTHGVDTFPVRSLLFVVLTALTVKAGSASLMGFLSGITLELVTPAPIRFYILFGVLAYGLVYDAYMNLRGFRHHVLKTDSVLIATTLSSLAMSVVALSIFTLAGFFPVGILPLIWTLGILRDIAMGIIGSVIGIKITRRIVRSGLL